jgi:HAD superfamily hydrolase (TIGR01509 family)
LPAFHGSRYGGAVPALVIFDCDGVLVDSEPIAVRIDVVMLRDFGLVMSEAEVIKRFVGRSPEVMREAIEAHLGHRLPAGWEAPYDRLRRRAYEAELRPVDGLPEALDAITLPTCVASSSSHGSLRHKLELTGLYERFAGRIFSASDVTEGKPAPDLFLHAAAQMGAAPAECVVVEDSRHGVLAARAAGMAVLAYAGGGLTPAAALAGPETTVFDDMRRLPALLALAAR